MSSRSAHEEPARLFGLADWTAWLDDMARRLFGVSGAEFEAGYGAGTFGVSGVADDLAAVLPLIRQLRHLEPSGSAEIEAAGT